MLASLGWPDWRSKQQHPLPINCCSRSAARQCDSWTHGDSSTQSVFVDVVTTSFSARERKAISSAVHFGCLGLVRMVRMERSCNSSGSGGRADRRDEHGVSAKRALVKWAEGVDANKFTHDVDLDWIIDLNRASPVYPETYAIEWRVLPKPRSGWPVYDGIVLDISSDLEYLKSRAQELRREQTHSDSDGDGSFSSSTGSSGRHGSQNSRRNDRDRDLVDVNSDEVRKLLLSLVTRDSINSRRSSQGSTPPTEEKVCIGKSLWVSAQTYAMAANAPSPGRMVRPLLRQAFSRRRLIKSSYAGQKRKKDGTVVAKPGLKKYQKMADIHAFVMKKFPHISQASFGATVNSFLGEKPNVIHQMEYVEESEESEEDDH